MSMSLRDMTHRRIKVLNASITLTYVDLEDRRVGRDMNVFMDSLGIIGLYMPYNLIEGHSSGK